MARRLITVCFVGVLWWSTSAQSQSVPVGYKQVASEYGLPPALLYSVALTESGQSSLSEGQFRPWPWSGISSMRSAVAGDQYRYATG